MIKTYLMIFWYYLYLNQAVTNEVLIDFRGETQIFWFQQGGTINLNSNFLMNNMEHIYSAKRYRVVVTVAEVMLFVNLNHISLEEFLHCRMLEQFILK